MIKVLRMTADWCSPCRAFAPVFSKVSQDLASENIHFEVCDIDEHPDVAQSFNISSIPTVLILKDNEVADRIVGLVGVDELKGRIEAAAD